MKHLTITLIALVALALGSCRIQRVDTSADLTPVTQTIATDSIQAINLKCPLCIRYTQSDSTSVVLKGPKEYLTHYTVTNKDGLLLIEADEDMHDFIVNSGNIRVKSVDDYTFTISASDTEDAPLPVLYVSSPSLNSVSVWGSGDFTADSLYTNKKLTLKVDGSGDISIGTVRAGWVENMVAGSGDIVIDLIHSGDVYSTVTGSGDIAMRGIYTTTSTALINGSGDITAHFLAADKVWAQVNGSGDVKLTGTARNLDQKVNGSGDIDASGLTVSN